MLLSFDRKSKFSQKFKGRAQWHFQKSKTIDPERADSRGAALRRHDRHAQDLSRAACPRPVGISKGSFYKFFDSKELLFFAALEDIHTEGYAVAQQALRDNAALPPAERAEAAILGMCRWLSETRALVFIENDAEFLLRRLPQEVKSAHYHDDEVHIRALLEGSGLQPKGGMALAAATVRGLILTVSHQEQIGELYQRFWRHLCAERAKELL